MIIWNNEMIEELKNTNSITHFASKYNMSYNTASNKKKTLLASEIKDNQPLVEKIDELNTSTISIIPSVILNIDNLIDKGTKFYLAETLNSISNIDKSISDIEHIIESHYDILNDDDMVKLSKNIGLLRRKRRLYKNEYDFLNGKRIECESFIKFLKEIKNYSKVICDKKYSTRVLKEELGHVHITNPNNSELITLREKVRDLESRGISRSEEEIKRVLDLEKFRIKQSRKLKREKGELVVIDELVTNWKEMFNSMDSITKKEILDECYNMINKSTPIIDSQITDYIVWNEVLPTFLYNKQYFLKNNKM